MTEPGKRLCKRVAMLRCLFCEKTLCMSHAREPCYFTVADFDKYPVNHAFDSVTATYCTVEVSDWIYRKRDTA